MSEFKLTRRPLLERAKMFGLGDEVEALVEALRFAHDIAEEELSHARVGTGAEVALRHIKRRTGEVLSQYGEKPNA